MILKKANSRERGGINVEKGMSIERAWFVYKCHHNNRNMYCSVAHCHCSHDSTWDNKICEDAKKAEEIVERYMSTAIQEKQGNYNINELVLFNVTANIILSNFDHSQEDAGVYAIGVIRDMVKKIDVEDTRKRYEKAIKQYDEEPRKLEV